MAAHHLHARVALLRTTLTGEWKPAGYPRALNHLGDHLRKRRMILGLQQKAVALATGADLTSVANWEGGRTRPAVRFWPAVIEFLGYDPRPVPNDLLGLLVHHRIGLVSSRDGQAPMRRSKHAGDLGEWFERAGR